MKAPSQQTIDAVKERLKQTKPQRENSLDAIRRGSPLEAEPEVERRVARIQAITGVDTGLANQIAANVPPKALGVIGPARRMAEKIQGKTVDYVPVSFLALAQKAAAAVGRVAFRDGSPQGSGFMCSNRLFLTNNHVISKPQEAANFVLEFDYELDIHGQPRAITRYELAPEVFFVTSPEDELDYTLIAVGKKITGPKELSEFGCCGVSDASNKHMLGEFVNIVQHPQGDFKKAVLRENRLVSRLDFALHYIADTEPGSSGSPVFNDQWQPIALHHWGEPFRQTEGPGGAPLPRELNEGIRISAIVKNLKARKSKLTAQQQGLLERIMASDAPEIAPGTDTAVDDGSGRPEEGAPAPETGPSKRVTWTIPLEVTVSLGGIHAGGAAGATISASSGSAVVSDMSSGDAVAGFAGEAITIDRKYSNRNGYNPKFLPGQNISLPKMTQDQRNKAAKLIHPPANGNPHELKYQHFSVVVSAERRMAFFTAVNIDGATSISVNRDTGEPRESAEATEKWFDDPRIEAQTQSAQDLYDKQKPARLFDRGHLVRREDPNWGTPARAKRANADTFHFTNCTPQASGFNQSAKFWQGIENYILDNARAEREKLTVFTGPVFDDNDRNYRYVRVPKAFWKILARVEDGELVVTSFLADQSDFLADGLPEAFDQLKQAAQFQTNVREIERLTRLDFGSLRDHDAFTGPEAAGKRKPLLAMSDIVLSRPTRNRGERRKRKPRG